MDRRATLKTLAATGIAATFGGVAIAARVGANTPFARRSPESQGIDPAGIAAFLDEIAARSIELHSLMILRHGAVVAEGCWAPYVLGAPHDVYSASKTFTSTAIGLAMAEGKLASSTRLTDVFPDKLPRNVDPRLARLEVSHLLTLSTGHAPDFEKARVTGTDDWVQAFLADPIVDEPGSKFSYENGASYMLSAIIQKLYGTTLVEFLDRRLFAPLGIATPYWETCPRGINTGGWGLSLPTDAMARFGQLYLDQGRWHGRQLVPTRWIAEASSAKIQQRPELPVTIDGVTFSEAGAALEKLKATTDAYHGYGYLIWRGRHDSYRAEGAFGQEIIVLPRQEAVIVTTGGRGVGLTDAVWRHILPAMHSAPLRAAGAASQRLRHRLAALTLTPPAGQARSPATGELAGRRFSLTDNPLGAEALSFGSRDGMGTLALERAGKEIVIPMGCGRWINSRHSAPGLVPWPAQFFGRTVHPTDVSVAGAYAWAEDRTLMIRLQYTQTPHHHLLAIRLDEEGIACELSGMLGPARQFRGKAEPSQSG